LGAKLKPEAVYSYLKSRGITHLSPYVYAREKMKLCCDACEFEWPATYDNIKQGKGCPNCSKRTRAYKTSAKKRLSEEEVNKRLSKYNVKLGAEYRSHKTATTLTCLVCGFEWHEKVKNVWNRSADGFLCPREENPTDPDRLASPKKSWLDSKQKHLYVPKSLEGLFSNYSECLSNLYADLRDRVLKNGGSGDFETLPKTISNSPVSFQCKNGHTCISSLLNAYQRKHLCSTCGPGFETNPRWQVSLPRVSELVANSMPSPELIEMLTKSEMEFIGVEKASGYLALVTKCRKCKQLIKKSVSRVNRLEVSPICSCSDGSSTRESFAKRLLSKVKERGGICLSDTIDTSKDHYVFQCAEEHDPWPATGGSILYGNSWCRTCAGHEKRDLDELRSIIKARGGVLLTQENSGVDGTYEYKCNFGHTNNNSWKKIEGGQWCSSCRKTGKSEEIARHVLQELFKIPFPKKRPKWLRNSEGRQMELDGYSEELGLAFEYQGIQHFQETSMFSTNLKKRMLDDRKKAELCDENGVVLLITTYQDAYEDFQQIFKNQLKEKGFPIQGIDFDSPVDMSGAYIKDDRIEELREILSTKGLELVSNKFLTVNVEYDIRCTQCGYQFKAPANRYLSPSRGPAGCDQCNRSSGMALLRYGLGIDELHAFAKTHGGKLLSSTYVGSEASYWWACKSADHLFFQASFNNLKFRGQFCPYCENRGVRSGPVNYLGTLLWKFGMEPVERLNRATKQTKTKCTKCLQISIVDVEKFALSPQGCCLSA
jgi:hypothetical protein